LGGREVSSDWQDGRIGRMFSPVINIFLQLHVDCVCYISVDYRTERLVDSITIVEIHINISTYTYVYYSVVHHVRILHKAFLGHEHNPYVFMMG
jgi:hypothetical protein